MELLRSRSLEQRRNHSLELHRSKRDERGCGHAGEQTGLACSKKELDRSILVLARSIQVLELAHSKQELARSRKELRRSTMEHSCCANVSAACRSGHGACRHVRKDRKDHIQGLDRSKQELVRSS